MKRKSTFVLGILLLTITAYAQKQKKSCLYLDSTARKHEIQLNVGAMAGSLFSNGNNNGIYTDLSYARVYKGTHFLRTGIGFGIFNSTDQFLTSGNNSIPNAPDSMLYEKYSTRNNIQLWSKVGYEVSIGKRKTRFLFGVDLLVGYAKQNSYERYTSTDLNQSIVYFKQQTYNGMMLGLNPRASVRYNFSKIFSGGVTVGVYGGTNMYFSERNYSGTGDWPGFTPTYTSYFDFRFKPELNLIFRFP